MVTIIREFGHKNELYLAKARYYQSSSSCWSSPDSGCNVHTFKKDEKNFDNFSADKTLYIKVVNENREYWLENIKHLNRSSCLICRGIITQAVLDEISELRNLKKLHLEVVRAKKLTPLSNLRDLTHLDICFSGLKDDYRFINDLLNLQTLSLGLSPSTNDLKFLNQINAPNVTCLTLDSGAMSSPLKIESLEPISSLKNLQVIVLGNVIIKDKNYNALNSMSELKYIFTSR